MKAPPALKGPGEHDITPAVLAIGRPLFSQALIGTLQRVAGVGHCMVFSFEGEHSCTGYVGDQPCQRILRYVATATYK